MHIHGRTFLCSLLCVTSLVGAIPNFANEKEPKRNFLLSCKKPSFLSSQPTWIHLGKWFYVVDIWRCTVEKSQTIATSVTLHPFEQAIWIHSWKGTVKKSPNATSVIMRPLGQTVWGHIWKCTVEKSQTYATNVILRPLWQTVWGHICKCTAEQI